MQNGRSPFNTTSPYASLRDMFDGGGAGQSGAKFEGGGLLSFLANAFASPMGSQQGMQAAPPAVPMPQSAPAYSAAPVTAAPPPVTTSTLPRQEFDFLTMMQAMAAQRQQQAGASFAPFAATPQQPVASSALTASPQIQMFMDLTARNREQGLNVFGTKLSPLNSYGLPDRH